MRLLGASTVFGLHVFVQLRIEQGLIDPRITHGLAAALLLGLLLASGTATAQPSLTGADRLTLCSYRAPELVTGWRGREWQSWNCSHGLPPTNASWIGGGRNASGTSGQVVCGATSGSHYNHPTQHGANAAEMDCLYLPADTVSVEPSITRCGYSWSGHATGWRHHTWSASDCSHGLPGSNWRSIGQAQNGNGTIGQASCTPTSGSHYNHPTVHGPTSASVSCVFVAPDPAPEPDVTLCSRNWPGLASGWRHHTWSASDCSHGLPGSGWASLGQAQNGAGHNNQASCTTRQGGHFNAVATSGTTTCLFVRLTLKPPPQVAYGFDTDHDGRADSNLSVAPCAANTATNCLHLDSERLSARQIALPESSKVGPGAIRVIGDHTDDRFNEVSLVHVIDRNSHTSPALSVLDLDRSKVIAHTAAPAHLRSFKNYPLTAYTEYPRDPTGRLHPFLAPDYGDEQGGNTWGYACLLAIGQQTGRCGRGFRETSTAAPSSFTSSWFRNVGGYLQDLDGDGWEDIHLPYHYTIRAISTRTGEILNDISYDIAAADGQGSPTGFHSGRNYGRHTAVAAPNGQLRTIMIGGPSTGTFTPDGRPTGAFLDALCNVSRFVGVLESTPGQPSSRRLAWSRYFGFHSNSFSGTTVTRPGDFADGCVHGFSDSRSVMDGQRVVIVNYFRADYNSPLNAVLRDKCVAEQIQFNQGNPTPWYECANKHLGARGDWAMTVMSEDTGAGLTGDLQTYIHGMSNKLLPSREQVYLVESLPTPVRFDMADVPASRLVVRALVGGLWAHRGSFPIAGRPKIHFQGAQGSRGTASYTAYAELTLRDIDGDGLMDVQLLDGSWVGYSRNTTTFVVKHVAQ